MLLTRRSGPPPAPCSPAVGVTLDAFALAAAGAGALSLACELIRPDEHEDMAQKASRKKLSSDFVFIAPSFHPSAGAAAYFACPFAMFILSSAARSPRASFCASS